MAYRQYPLVIKQIDDGYHAYFPDLPGCALDAPTLQGAVDEGAAAIKSHVAAMVERGEALPSSSPINRNLVGKSDTDWSALFIGVHA